MAVTKTIDVDGRQVTFRASAAIPRLYRNKFHRDIYRDLSELQKVIDESDAENSSLDTFSLELFENIAWLMAKHADKTVPDTPEEWLDEFGTFSIYEILPQIIELWGLNTEQQVTVKKKTACDRTGNDDPALPAPLRADRALHLRARPPDDRHRQRHVRGDEQRRLGLPGNRDTGNDGQILRKEASYG